MCVRVAVLQVLLEQATFLVGGIGFLLGGASYVIATKGRSSLQGMDSLTKDLMPKRFCPLSWDP